MKTIRSFKFVFTEEEIAHVRAIWKLLQDMENCDYDELCDQIEAESNCDFSDFLEGLDNLLCFMENHVDLQDDLQDDWMRKRGEIK